MKKFILICTVLFASSTVFSQASMSDGKNQLNLGVGLSSWGIPVYFGFDHGMSNVVSLGGEVSFRSHNNRWNGKKYNHSIIGLSVNGNYHLNDILEISSKYDLYAGLNLGFYSWSSPNEYKGSTNSGIGLGAQVGGRVSISSNTSINLELGGGNVLSGGKFGFTFNI